MNEFWARAGLIIGALALAYLITVILRARASGSPRRLDSTSLRSGIYLFSSSACPDCRRVRNQLADRLGEDGFNEFNWEQHPGLFHDLDVTAVPATLVVEDDGSGVLFPGRADDALASLGP